MIALIPARKNSKRILGKNTKPLGGKPLIRYTIEAALESECFEDIWVCSDDPEVWRGELREGVMVYQRRAVPDDQRDIEWVSEVLSCWGTPWEDFAILRPTSPFRGPETIQRAYTLWQDIKGSYDSMRAIRKASECPWKMWRYAEDTHEIDPITSVAARKHLHSRPTQDLEEAWVQTAGLEIAHTRTPLELGTIAGERVAGFVVAGPESLDLNTPDDWDQAEWECIARDMQQAMDTP